jgi:uncharacterized membrane protein
MKTNIKKSASIKMLLLNTIIMALFTLSIRWPAAISKNRIIILILLYGIMLIGIPVLAYTNRMFSLKINECYGRMMDCFSYIKNNWKQILIRISTYLVLAILSYSIAYVYSFINQTRFNSIAMYLMIGISYIITTVFFLRKSIADKPERLFFCLLMIAGTSLVAATPNNTGITWDDQIHYSRVWAMTDFVDQATYISEQNVFSVAGNGALTMRNYTEQGRIEENTELNTSFANDEKMEYSNSLSLDALPAAVSYVPYAVGTMFGRALHLPFTWCMKLAKIFNLLLYGLIVSLAMKKLKSGKILVATIALAPTVIFMASNFSYDPWIVGFALYGFCSFFGILQNQDQKITRKEIIQMLGAFILAVLPKAVYFIMMLPLFFLPKKVFADQKQHRRYLLAVFLCGLFLASTFVLPMLIHGAGTGDSRGGTTVNATEQISFILNEPLKFMAILFNFLSEYLNFGRIGNYFLDFAYVGVGNASLMTAAMVIVGSVALLDKNGTKYKTKRVCASVYIGCILAMILVATALYISFTAVRSSTISGCQLRYIIPTLFPVLYTISPNAIVNKMNKTLFNSIPMLFMTVTLLISTIGIMITLY